MQLTKNLCGMLAASAIAVGGALSPGAANAEDLTIVFTHHSSVSNTFWRGVKRGFDEACALVNADCQMVFTNTEGSIAEQVSNIQAAIARRPDAIVTAIANDEALCPLLKQAGEAGIIVLASNVDAKSGSDCGREAYMGQNFVDAGEVLGRNTATLFPADGPLNILIGVSAPGQTWSEQRAEGIEKALAAYQEANPDRKVTINRIDSGTDLAVTEQRVMAYLDANPDLSAYFDMGFWEASVARALENRGIPAGKILLSGFDVIPDVVEYMEKGYIQTVVNQGPYLQGYLPVMQVYLMKQHAQPAWSVDTGRGVFTIDQAKAALETFK